MSRSMSDAVIVVLVVLGQPLGRIGDKVAHKSDLFNSAHVR